MYLAFKIEYQIEALVKIHWPLNFFLDINDFFGKQHTVMPWCIYGLELIANTILTLNMSMAIILYKTFELVICIFLFGLSESSKKTLFKGLIRKIIKAKVAEKCIFLLFSEALNSIISGIIFLIWLFQWIRLEKIGLCK